MKDPIWQEAHRALLKFLRPDDIILLPYGDWPKLPCKSTFYGDLITIDDATVFVLHKGRFGAIDKSTLRNIADTWQCIFGNGVFLCFSKDIRARRDIRQGRSQIDYRVLQTRFPSDVLRRFLQSKQLRRRSSCIWYVHLPKAAGTWMWRPLARAFPSRIYFPSFAAFAANPPDIDEYDLIGGHLPISIIEPYLSPEDWVIGLMRDPTERLLSAFLHSRRPTEDPSTFTATMRAMRHTPFRDFIRTERGKLEAQQQLLMLGCDYATGPSSSDGQMYLDRAGAIISANQFLFAPCTRSTEFLQLAAQLYRTSSKFSAPTNTNDYALQSSDIVEFHALRDEVRSINIAERQLYNIVSKRFEFDDANGWPTRLRLRHRRAMGSLHRMASARFALSEFRGRARAARINRHSFARDKGLTRESWWRS